MAKFKLKKGVLTYKGQMYCVGDIVEMDVFDNALPIAWFEEIKESKKIKSKQNKKEEVIANDYNNDNSY